MPLYSGVAAALFTLLKGPGGDAITWKTEEQGQFWSKNFHSGSSATNFTQLSNLLDLGKFNWIMVFCLILGPGYEILVPSRIQNRPLKAHNSVSSNVRASSV